jgi:hypothetical protein
MPTLTYIPIASFVANGTSHTTVNFTNIPTTYRDLVLIGKMANNTNATATNGKFTFNGTGSGRYFWRHFYGNSINQVYLTGSDTQNQFYNVLDTLSPDWTQWIWQINSANATASVYAPTMLVTESSPKHAIVTSTKMWDPNGQVTSIQIYSSDNQSDVWAAGTTFSLYGIGA